MCAGSKGAEASLIRNARNSAELPNGQEQLPTLLPRLRRFAMTLTRSEADADDLVQTALEKAIQRWNQWQPGTRLDSWLYRIIHTSRIDDLRLKRTRTAHVEWTEEQQGLAAPEDVERSVFAAHTLAATLAAMESLSESERALLGLVCVDGMSYRDAAETLEMPIGTVMSRLARARKKLHQMVVESD